MKFDIKQPRGIAVLLFAVAFVGIVIAVAAIIIRDAENSLTHSAGTNVLPAEQEERTFIRHKIEPQNPFILQKKMTRPPFAGEGDPDEFFLSEAEEDDAGTNEEEHKHFLPDEEALYSPTLMEQPGPIIARLKRAENVTNMPQVYPDVTLTVEKDEIYRYEPLTLTVTCDSNGFRPDGVSVYIRRAVNKRLRPNGDARFTVNVHHIDKNTYRAIYLHPFGASTGKYEFIVHAEYQDVPKIFTKEFTVISRPHNALTNTLGVISMEWNIDLKNKRIPGIDGETMSYHGFYDWARFIGADAFWVLAGQTMGWDATINKKSPWAKAPLRNIRILADSTNKGDVKLGAYIMTYFTPGYGNKKADYPVAVGYSRGNGLTDSRHISLNSEKRLKDIIALLHEFETNENIEHVGIDFIRTGEYDGMEMADEAARVTGMNVPSGWYRMSDYDKSLWLGANLFARRNREVTMKWRWFRAHKVATIVKRIRDSGITKPLWAFTLGWDHGTEHGQDPYMFFDAGLSYDAVMLYEADRTVYDNMMRHWPRYLRGAYNVLAGNMVDVRLLDGSPLAQVEFAKRLYEAEEYMNGDDRIRGVFFHDISRMFWSRNRGVRATEWACVSAGVLTSMRERNGETPITLSLSLDEARGEGELVIKNVTTNEKLEGITLTPYQGSGIYAVNAQEEYIDVLAPEEAMVIPFSYSRVGGIHMIAFHARLADGRSGVVFRYTNLPDVRELALKNKP